MARGRKYDEAFQLSQDAPNHGLQDETARYAGLMVI